jgi:UDP-N-acetylmuramate: L-alanyl-gamma-D-glutamyl-meso-diaminopimelate ligase
MGNQLGTLTDPFVIEGDEYDSAFFDKRSKFIHYAPYIAVLNNLEFDHADIFRDLADVQRTFNHLTRIVPRHGWIVLNGDDENLRAFSALPWTRIVRVGTGEGNDLRLGNFSEDATGAAFTLWWRGKVWADIHWAQPGLYNARNAAMAATAAALALLDETAARAVPVGVPLTDESAPPLPSMLQLEPLSRFRGVKRRQEILVSNPALTVIEDFGHHPTALAETLRSFRARFKGAILTAVFEPRSNTARIKIMQSGFSRALALADEIYLGPVNRADKLSADERLDTEAVVQHLEAQGLEAHAFGTNIALLDKLIASTLAANSRRRVVVFFSNGPFDGIISRYATAAKAAI